MRIAVIGAGLISRSVHLPTLRRSPHLDLRAISDLDPDRARELAGRYGARVADVGALLADPDIEAVLIATPGNHARIARDALAAGKHVLAEKPLALTIAEAEEAGDLARRAGLVLQVGSMKMYDALVPLARDAVLAMNDVRLVEIGVRHPADAPQVAHLRLDPPAAPAAPAAAAIAAAVADADAYDTARVGEAIGDVPVPWQRFYRGVLCGSVLHEMSLLRALGIRLPKDFDHADVFEGPGAAGSASDGPPSIIATATLSPATRLVLSWNWLADYPRYEEQLRITASDGALTLDVAPPYVLDAPSTLEVVRGGDGHGGGEVVRSIVGRDGAFQRQLEAFAASIRHGRSVIADATGAADDVRCLQALMRAIAVRQGVSLGGEAVRAA